MDPNSGRLIQAYVPDLWVNEFRTRLTEEADRIGRNRRGPTPRSALVDAAVAVFEELLASIAAALQDQQSTLRAELRKSNGARRAVEAQLASAHEQLLAMHRSGRPGFLRASLRGLGSLLSSVAEGAAAAAVTVALIGAAGSNELSSADFTLACAAIDSVVDTGGGYHTEATPEGEETPDQPGSHPGDEDGLSDEALEDEDPWLHLQDADGRYRLPGSSDEHAGTMWRDSGFLPGDADEWVSHGFDVPTAAEWSALGFHSSWAESWRDHGFTPSEAASWADDFSAERAQYWFEGGFEPEEAYVWESNEVDRFEAADWADAGFDAADYEEWAPQFGPAQAVDWHAAGFGPDDARQWRSVGATPDEAALRSKAGLVPESPL